MCPVWLGCTVFCSNVLFAACVLVGAGPLVDEEGVGP